MYIPKQFEITETDKQLGFIESNSFGELISHVDGRLYSTHLPFYLSKDKSKLIGHLAIQNPQAEDLESQEVLVTFVGPHGYISPTWYLSPGVPTWNYQSVHVYGHAKIIHELEEVRCVVDSLVSKYEEFNESPWTPEYKDSLLSAIVAFEVSISEIQCKFKLSQNRSVEDRNQIIAELIRVGAVKLAEAMACNEL